MDSECWIPVIPCRIMSYRELNPNIFFTLSVLYLSDGTYVSPKFCLRVFPILDIPHNFHVRLFAFPWWYFELVGIYVNSMYYFNQRVGRLTHCYWFVVILCYVYSNKAYFKVRLLVPCQTVLLDPFGVLLGMMRFDKMRNELWGRSATEYLNIISCVVLTLS